MQLCGDAFKSVGRVIGDHSVQDAHAIIGLVADVAPYIVQAGVDLADDAHRFSLQTKKLCICLTGACCEVGDDRGSPDG